MNALKDIESRMETIGQSIRNEEKVYQAELEERQRLGLHGDAAIRHYNEWMQRHGMQHLMVKEESEEQKPTRRPAGSCALP